MSARPTFSLVINHTPWRPERVEVLREMLTELRPVVRGVPFLLNDADYRKNGKHWAASEKPGAMTKWVWAAAHDTTHHLFLDDDLHLAPRFWDCLTAMTDATEGAPVVGLLPTHPDGPRLFDVGNRWYQADSLWLRAKGYVLSHKALTDLLSRRGDWRQKGSPIGALYEYLLESDTQCLFPLPTIVEQRTSISDTSSRYSRERVSWRTTRQTRELANGDFQWLETPHYPANTAPMTHEMYWTHNGGPRNAPILGDE